jgi:hypothetical protein
MKADDDDFGSVSDKIEEMVSMTGRRTYPAKKLNDADEFLPPLQPEYRGWYEWRRVEEIAVCLAHYPYDFHSDDNVELSHRLQGKWVVYLLVPYGGSGDYNDGYPTGWVFFNTEKEAEAYFEVVLETKPHPDMTPVKAAYVKDKILRENDDDF